MTDPVMTDRSWLRPALAQWTPDQVGVKFEHAPHALTESSWAANFRNPDGHILSIFGPK